MASPTCLLTDLLTPTIVTRFSFVPHYLSPLYLATTVCGSSQ